ncbi:MAG: hypothetical protein ITG02_16260 [Patulibacter sp.]|nr:hypothetical protein [Patulibacter sp.]
MRHPQLYAALRSAAFHAGRELGLRVTDGDEVPYELLQHARRSRARQGGATLYSYRPLVGLYVERQSEALEQLPAITEARHTMVAVWGVDAYLQAQGVVGPPSDPHDRAALAVRLFLERVFEDSPDFTFEDDQFERAFRELDAVLTANATETVVAIPLVGVEPVMPTVAITRGVALQRPDAVRGELPEAALAGPDGTPADAVATLRWAARPGSSDAPRRAREAARRLVTALRLHFPGGAPAAGPLIWLRAASGPWHAMALGGTFASRGCVAVDADDVPELRTFVDLVARRLPERGEVAWALRRWTLALDRDRPEEALTDLLLAGRALLEPEGPRSGRLAGRLAALCATGDERTYLARRLARLALQEQEVIAGSRRVDRELPEQVDELADCLRAVLRDSVCGHLSGDLVEIAEEILDGLADEPASPRDAWREEQLERERRRREEGVVLDARAADDDLGIAPAREDDDLDLRIVARGRGRDTRNVDPEIQAQRLPPAIVPLDPVGAIDAARMAKLAPDDVWLEQTWIEPQVQEPTVQPDDDATGPWPTAG